MAIVGTPAEAKFIYEWDKRQNEEGHPRWFWTSHSDYLAGERQYGHTPKGWRFLGAGAYRIALASPSGVCYKIERDSSDYGQTNVKEYVNYLHLLLECSMPEGSRLPSYTLYVVDSRTDWKDERVPVGVSAMELIPGVCVSRQKDGPTDRDLDMMKSIGRSCRLNDVHGGNVVRHKETGEYVLIDLGA